MLNPNIGGSMDAPADEESMKKFRSAVPKQVKTGFSPDQVNLSADSQMDRTSNIFSVSRLGSQRLRRSCDSQISYHEPQLKNCLDQRVNLLRKWKTPKPMRQSLSDLVGLPAKEKLKYGQELVPESSASVSYSDY